MDERDPAEGRYWTLQLVRFACIALVAAGVAVIGPGGETNPLGAVLLVAGALGFFFLPRELAKRWKSEDE